MPDPNPAFLVAINNNQIEPDKKIENPKLKLNKNKEINSYFNYGKNGHNCC